MRTKQSEKVVWAEHHIRSFLVGIQFPSGCWCDPIPATKESPECHSHSCVMAQEWIKDWGPFFEGLRKEEDK